tara:strand:+ start:2520 stop:3692 length:1173 start_codon:yes stop_codon:yes gene_type:complete
MRLFTQYYLILFLCVFSLSYTQNKVELELFIFNDISYFSAKEFCASSNYSCNQYPEKAKIELLIQDEKFIFSLNSSFVKINDVIHQMITRVRLIDGIFYVPLNSFMHLLAIFEPHSFIINNDTKKIILQKEDELPALEEINSLADNNDQALQEINALAEWGIKTVIIDPGHGGKDPGAIGYYNIKEKHIVLDISKELGALIKKHMPNINVVYTREDDTFLGLKNRTHIANKSGGHIFLSIHANASTAKSARGFEVFLLQPNSVDDAIDVAVRENASILFEENPEEYEQNQMFASISEIAYSKESEKLAVFINTAVKKELPRTRMRGVKQAGFYVLVGAAMPKVLIEVGFLTNKSEAQLLNRSSYRAKMARGLFDGLQDYIEYYNSQNNIK